LSLAFFLKNIIKIRSEHFEIFCRHTDSYGNITSVAKVIKELKGKYKDVI